MKKAEILVLDPKRSNAINIGMTVLPAIHVIKTAILNFDEYAISKEGIEVRPIYCKTDFAGAEVGIPLLYIFHNFKIMTEMNFSCQQWNHSSEF